MVASETIIAPRTDSSASRFWGGTMVFPLLANCSSPRRNPLGLVGRVSPLSLDTRPADSRLPRCGTRSARAWLENHSGRRLAGEFRLFAARAFPGTIRAWTRRAVFAVRPFERATARLGLAALSRLGDDHLDRRGHPAADLDLDHEAPGFPDRLVELDLLAVHSDPAGSLDRFRDLRRGDRAEQLAVLAGRVADGEDGLREERGGLAGSLGRPALLLLGPLAAPLGLLERALGRGLGELARDQVGAQVAGRDVDRRAGLAEALDVLEQDGHCHLAGLH